MLIGVISDTHGDVARTRAAVRMLESLEVQQVLHCGDIGTPEIIELLQTWPAHFVLGNCDYDRAKLKKAVLGAGQSFHDRFADIELGGVRIAIVHGDDWIALQEAIHCGHYGLVCTGHTHVARQETHGATLVLNPGAVHRANPHTIAVVKLPEREVTIVTI